MKLDGHSVFFNRVSASLPMHGTPRYAILDMKRVELILFPQGKRPLC